MGLLKLVKKKNFFKIYPYYELNDLYNSLKLRIDNSENSITVG